MVSYVEEASVIRKPVLVGVSVGLMPLLEVDTSWSSSFSLSG